MRDWNKAGHKVLFIEAGVFSIPMRDWNISLANLQEKAEKSFQHTYEGLKHVDGEIVRFWGECFQHTYEGLKRGCMQGWDSPQAGFSAYLWGIETGIHQTNSQCQQQGFQHTYEGLKPLPANSHTTTEQVFSIPMRDWNIQSRAY